MADIKWIKITTNMYEDEKIRLIDAMPNPDITHYAWIRLLIQAGKTNANGYIYLNENIPYTAEMLATIFCRPVASIRLALKILSDFQMIEIAPDNIIKIINWDKHQNIEGMERVRAQNRKRVEAHREKKKQMEKDAKENAENEKQGIFDVKAQAGQEKDKQEVSHVNVKGEWQENGAMEDENEVSLDEAAVNSNINIEEVKQNSDTSQYASPNEKASDISHCNASNEEASNSKGCFKAAVEDLAFNDGMIKSVSGNSNNVTKSINNAAKDLSSVTHNNGNVTVTQQNKKENEKKNKKEIENENNKESKSNNNINADVNNKGSRDEASDEGEKAVNLSQGKKARENEVLLGENDINSKAMELMTYHEKITGIIGGLNYVALRLAIDMHGDKAVKLAMDKALEVNHTEMGYINGILKNWRREGYPKDHMEVKNNGIRRNRKDSTEDKNEFAGFKPKKPRNLTDRERKSAEKNLI